MEWKTERKYPNRKYRKEIIESLSERQKTQIKNKKKNIMKCHIETKERKRKMYKN